MSGFLDHLFDPSSSGKKGRERIRYREKVRAHIQDAPAVRRLTPQSLPNLTYARLASGNILPNIDLVMEQIGEAASATRFRDWKQDDKIRPIWRLDPVVSEEQVLETRAMGADAYTLEVRKHDQASLQFLVEVGRDYGLPAILSCRSPEDLALGLLVQDGGILWLRGELQNEGLFDLETLRGRTLIYEGAEELQLSPTWVCSVIQLLDSILLPPEEAADEEARSSVRAQQSIFDESTSHSDEED